MAKDLRSITLDGEVYNVFHCIGTFSNDWTLGTVGSNTTGYTFTAYTAAQKCLVIGWIFVDFPARQGGWRRAMSSITGNTNNAQKVDSPTDSVVGLTIPICCELANGGKIDVNVCQTSGSGLRGILVRANLRLFTPRT